jgi:signal transduction histidine kinase
VPESLGRVPFETGTALYRIAEEALRNVRKHAPGSAVDVQLLIGESGLQLGVEDDGPGFNLDGLKVSSALGLLAMQERARMAGGYLSLSSTPGREL